MSSSLNHTCSAVIDHRLFAGLRRSRLPLHHRWVWDGLAWALTAGPLDGKAAVFITFKPREDSVRAVVKRTATVLPCVKIILSTA